MTADLGATAQQLKKSVLSLLRIHPGEGRKTALMFGVMMCVVGSFIVGRVARDSLFLSRYPVSTLPHLYIAIALGVSLQSYLYSRIADRYRRDRQLMVTIAALGLVYLAARVGLVWAGAWFTLVLYVAVELFGSLLVIQTWTLANEVFTTREAKRLFGLVGAGGVVSAVVVGFSIRGAVRLVGTEELLFVCAAALFIGLWLVQRLSKECTEELLTSLAGARREIRSRIALFADVRRVFSNRHLVFVAALMLALVLVMTFVDYLFKQSATAKLNDQEQLAGFFGLFYGLTGTVNILIQALATGRLLERFGVLVSLLLLPLALLGGTVAWLVAPALWSASLLKGADATLRYTVNDATLQLLYLPVGSHIRGRAKAFIDGIVRPLCIGLAGVGLAWVLPTEALGWILLVALTCWIGLAFAVRREYLSSLVNTLRSRRLDFDVDSSLVPDQAANQALKKALEDYNERNVLYALEMIPHTSRSDWSESLVNLIKHPSPRVRSKALKLLGELGSLHNGPVVYACMRDPNPSVLAAAIDAYCALGRERAVRTVALFLEHEDAAVRSATVVGMIRYGGLDGVLSSAEQLKTMLQSDQVEERVAGARILGEIQVKNFYHPLLELMTDASLAVRLSAIRAAGKMRSPELLPALVYRIDSPETRAAAAKALVAFGPPAVHLLQRVLTNPREALATRLEMPAILARIGDQPAMDALLESLEDLNPKLRSRVLEGIHRLRIHKPHLATHREQVRRAVRVEIRDLYRLALSRYDLELNADSLLADALSHRWDDSVRRISRLIGCLYPVRPVDAVFANLSSPFRRSRANALEVLDNLLDKGLKQLLLPVLDPNLQTDRIEIGQQTFGLEHRTRVEWMAELIADPEDWLSVCATYEAGEHGEASLIPAVSERTANDDPLLRETALVALAKLVPTQDFRRTAERHLRDPSPKVRNMAAWLCDRNDAIKQKGFAIRSPV